MNSIMRSETSAQRPYCWPTKPTVMSGAICMARAITGLAADTRAAHEENLRPMVRSAEGLFNIAIHWIWDENFRARIVDIVETMPRDMQRRFVTNLQRDIRNVGR